MRNQKKATKYALYTVPRLIYEFIHVLLSDYGLTYERTNKVVLRNSCAVSKVQFFFADIQQYGILNLISGRIP